MTDLSEITLPQSVDEMALEDRGSVTNKQIAALSVLREGFKNAHKEIKFNFLILTGLLPKKDFPEYASIPEGLFIEEGESYVMVNFQAKKLWQHFLGQKCVLDTLQMFLKHIGLNLAEFSFSEGFGILDNLTTTMVELAKTNNMRTFYLTCPAWSREEKLVVAGWLNFHTFWPRGYEAGSVIRMFMEKDGFFEGVGFGKLNIGASEYEEAYRALLSDNYAPSNALLEKHIP